MTKLVILLLVVACGNAKRVERQLAAVKAVSDGAVLLFDKQPGSELRLVDESGSVRWAAPLDGNPALFRRSDDGIIVTPKHIAVHVLRRRADGLELQFDIFSRADGRRSAVSLGSVPTDFEISQLSYTDGEILGDIQERQERPELVTIDLAKASIVRRVTLPFLPSRLQKRATDIYLRGLYQDAFVTKDGIVRAVPSEDFDRGCILDGRYWRIQKADRGYRFYTDEAPAREISIPSERPTRLQHCARAGERSVVFVEHGDSAEVLVLAADGTLISSLPADEVGPARTLLVESLPRFIAVRRARGTELAMIDLQEGRAAWAIGWSDVTAPILVNNRWYLGTRNNELGVVDALTGRLLLTKQLRGGPLQVESIGDRGIWVRHGGWRRDTAVTVLDPKTMTRVAGVHMELSDIDPSSPLAAIPRD